MAKYSLLVIIYLIAVISSSVASLMKIDVQQFYRVPFLNARWIDIGILAIVFSFLYSLAKKTRSLKNTNFIVITCFIYLIFELVQFIRTWGVVDVATQVSLFFCTLSMFIIIDLSFYAIPIEKIVSFLRKVSIWGAFAIIIVNCYLLYSFITGHVVVEDMDVRVAIEVIGSKETVYSFVLIPFVYAFGLYFIQKIGNFWEKVLFLSAILSIYGALIITFWRGTLVMILVITVYFLISSSGAKQIVLKIAGLLLFLGLGYFILGDTLASRGYDPVKKIVETAEFATDVNNPDWDKGRIVAQEFAINEWKNNLWVGAGYDALGRGKALPENAINPHNGVITSLFHRGILGTFILLLIFIVLFKYGISSWFIFRKNKTYEGEMVKLLILVSFFWIITFLTEEALWEKYSLSIEFFYLGLVTNLYKQQVE